MLVDRRGERVEPEHLRADVAVQPREPQHAAVDDARAPRASASPFCEPEAELGVFGAGLDVLVRVRLDARRHAHQHGRRACPSADERLEAVELVERVDDDPADAGVERGAQLGGRLVVAVEHDALGRETRRAARRAARRRSRRRGRDPLRRRGAPSRCRGTPCSRTRRRPPKLGAVLAAPGAQLVFVVHVQRRAELAREAVEVDAADRETRRRRRREPTPAAASGRTARHSRRQSSTASIVVVVVVVVEARHLVRARCTPSSPSAFARPMRHASASHSRACVSSASSVITRQSR